jgi:hypothetical protein
LTKTSNRVESETIEQTTDLEHSDVPSATVSEVV